MRITLYTLFFLCYFASTQAQNVVFADPNFKTALVNDVFVNTNGDGEIQLSEAIACTDIYVPNANISNTGGLENFVNLIYFDMSGNSISTLDLSIAPNLQEVRCFNNNLTTLTLPSTNTVMTVLDASDNVLTSLILPTNLSALDTLNLSDNQLASLDVSAAVGVRGLYCDNNLLTNLTVPSLASLTDGAIRKISCRNNRFTSLSMAQVAVEIDCGGNTQMDSLWITGNPSFRGDVACDNSQLVYVSVNNKVEVLDCSNNQLEELIISQQSVLENINCSNNQLDTLFLSHPALTTLDCSSNQLVAVRIFNSAATNLVNFDSRNNPTLNCIETSDLTNAQNNWTNRDAWTTINALGQCNGIWSPISTLPGLPFVKIYPNPTTKHIQLELGQVYQELVVTVYNGLGQTISHLETVSSSSIEVVLPVEKGVYFVQVQTETGRQSYKVIKE